MIVPIVGLGLPAELFPPALRGNVGEVHASSAPPTPPATPPYLSSPVDDEELYLSFPSPPLNTPAEHMYIPGKTRPSLYAMPAFLQDGGRALIGLGISMGSFPDEPAPTIPESAFPGPRIAPRRIIVSCTSSRALRAETYCGRIGGYCCRPHRHARRAHAAGLPAHAWRAPPGQDGTWRVGAVLPLDPRHPSSHCRHSSVGRRCRQLPPHPWRTALSPAVAWAIRRPAGEMGWGHPHVSGIINERRGGPAQGSDATAYAHGASGCVCVLERVREIIKQTKTK